jgi:hypothetical protein
MDTTPRRGKIADGTEKRARARQIDWCEGARLQRKPGETVEKFITVGASWKSNQREKQMLEAGC